jgi:rSAM/selenodomain-associated transferase 1
MPWSSATFPVNVENPVDNVDNQPKSRALYGRGPVLGIFAKQPLAGRVKTRLIPPLTPGEARELYRTALQETVVSLATVPASLVLCCAGRRSWFARAFPGVPLLSQGRGDLGARLKRVTTALFAAGGEVVAVVGSDSPDLPPVLVKEAFAALKRVDVAAIAAEDGGYALLALRRPVPGLFVDIPWSSAGVLAATEARAAALGLRMAMVGRWDDLDDLASLRRLLVRSPHCATAHHVRAHLGGRVCSGGG